jgi:hypothetical protein
MKIEEWVKNPEYTEDRQRVATKTTSETLKVMEKAVGTSPESRATISALLLTLCFHTPSAPRVSITDIANTIFISIQLLRVTHSGTVVAGIANAIIVCILLILETQAIRHAADDTVSVTAAGYARTTRS